MSRVAQMAKVEKDGNFWVVKVAGPHGWIVDAVWKTKREAELDAKQYRKNPMKKKRSAKQLANDKRLGKMAKARAKKRGKKKASKTKRKVRKVRKNPSTYRKVKAAVKRTYRKSKSAKPHLWHVFRCQGTRVMFLTYSLGGKPSWSGDRSKAIAFKASGQAQRYAIDISKMRGYAKYQLGSISQTFTTAQIRSYCVGKG